MNGKIITPKIYDEFYHTDEFCKVRIGDKWGCIDNKGNELIPVKYDEVGWFYSSLNFFSVKLNGKDGYADIYGNDTFL